MTADSSQTNGIKWAAAAAGGVTQAYLGYNTIGGSTEVMTNQRLYMKKISPANDCLITSIGAYLDIDTADQVMSFSTVLLADSSGSPERLLGLNMDGATTMILSGTSSAKPARWVEKACGIWVTAGDYWACVVTFNSSHLRIYYDGSGSDRYQTSGGQWVADAGETTVTTSSNKYSIRANTIR